MRHTINYYVDSSNIFWQPAVQVYRMESSLYSISFLTLIFLSFYIIMIFATTLSFSHFILIYLLLLLLSLKVTFKYIIACN